MNLLLECEGFFLGSLGEGYSFMWAILNACKYVQTQRVWFFSHFGHK